MKIKITYKYPIMRSDNYQHFVSTQDVWYMNAIFENIEGKLRDLGFQFGIRSGESVMSINPQDYFTLVGNIKPLKDTFNELVDELDKHVSKYLRRNVVPFKTETFFSSLVFDVDILQE